MDQYLYIPFLGGWTSINPSYFDVNYRGIGFWHTAISRSSPIDNGCQYVLATSPCEKKGACCSRTAASLSGSWRPGWADGLESHWKVWKPLRNSKLFWIHSFGDGSKPCIPVVHIKIAGKWMFIPLKMVSIGIDPYPFKFKIFFKWNPN